MGSVTDRRAVYLAGTYRSVGRGGLWTTSYQILIPTLPVPYHVLHKIKKPALSSRLFWLRYNRLENLSDYAFHFFRLIPANPTRPKPINKRLAGSETGTETAS